MLTQPAGWSATVESHEVTCLKGRAAFQAYGLVAGLEGIS